MADDWREQIADFGPDMQAKCPECGHRAGLHQTGRPHKCAWGNGHACPCSGWPVPKRKLNANTCKCGHDTRAHIQSQLMRVCLHQREDFSVCPCNEFVPETQPVLVSETFVPTVCRDCAHLPQEHIWVSETEQACYEIIEIPGVITTTRSCTCSRFVIG